MFSLSYEQETVCAGWIRWKGLRVRRHRYDGGASFSTQNGAGGDTEGSCKQDDMAWTCSMHQIYLNINKTWQRARQDQDSPQDTKYTFVSCIGLWKCPECCLWYSSLPWAPLRPKYVLRVCVGGLDVFLHNTRFLSPLVCDTLMIQTLTAIFSCHCCFAAGQVRGSASDEI